MFCAEDSKAKYSVQCKVITSFLSSAFVILSMLSTTNSLLISKPESLSSLWANVKRSFSPPWKSKSCMTFSPSTKAICAVKYGFSMCSYIVKSVITFLRSISPIDEVLSLVITASLI